MNENEIVIDLKKIERLVKYELPQEFKDFYLDNNTNRKL